MIEVSLIPQVKLELLKVRRQQKMVISICILVTIASVGIVALMSMYTFGGQVFADKLANDAITKNTEELRSIEDLPETLTLQAQLRSLTDLYADKNVSSRLFDVLSVVTPTGENEISINQITLNSEDKTIEIQAQARNGYEAAEVFKKTLAQTMFHFNRDGQAAEPVSIASDISEGERSYSEDGNERRVLRFTIRFVYADELFNSVISDGKVVGPSEQRVTDSTQGVPGNLFSGGGEE